MNPNYSILNGDCLEMLECLGDETVQTCVTSPPYFGLRDYGVTGQIGLENTVAEYVAKLVEVFAQVHRVLRNDGTLWLNLGDSYANDTKWGGSSGGKHAKALHGNTGIGREKRKTGFKSKDLMMIPARVAIALQDFGWYLRQDIIWHKPNPMPESVTDRCTKSHEYIFLLSKSPKYYFNHEAIREPNVSPQQFAHTQRYAKVYANHTERLSTTGQPNNVNNLGIHSRAQKEGRNRRSVWAVNLKPFSEAHFATFPEKLVEPCIFAGSREGDLILDPFNGAGTTGLVSLKHNRTYIGIELNPEYIQISHQRLRNVQTKLFQ